MTLNNRADLNKARFLAGFSGEKTRRFNMFKERLLKDKQVAEMLSISKDQVWRLARDEAAIPSFPRPVKIKKGTRWIESQIVNYINSLPVSV